MTNDLFNFRDYVLFLKDKLDNTELSQVVGVHGDYGAGKTTTMEIIEELYKEDALGYDNILKFSAWRNYYNNENTVWKALLYELAGKIYDVFDCDDIKNTINFDNIKLKEIKNINDLDISKNIDKVILLMEGFNLEENKTFFGKVKQYFEKIKKIQNPVELSKYLNNVKTELVSLYVKNISLEIQYNLYQDLKDFDGELKKGESEFQKNKFLGMLNLVSSIIPNLFSFEGIQKFSDLFQKEEQELIKPKIDSLEVIQRKFDILLSFYNLIGEENKKPLIIMVDDLDRILPEKSVEIIEILRIFFEKSNKIHFICAIDLRVIEKGIERKFNQLNKGGDLSRIEFEEYLEKIITIPFDLPAIPLVDFDSSKNIFGIDTLIDDKISDKINDSNKGSIDLIKNKITNIIVLDYYNNLKSTIEDFLIEYYSNKNGEVDIDGDIKIFKKYNIEISSINYHINDKKIEFKIKKMEEKLSISIKDVESKHKEYSLLKEVKQDYQENIQKINTITFKNIIKTGLQANPRKIKRFIDVFEIYFKILMYRNKKYNFENINFEKDSCYLAKMLIIKLEWDEIYKEFVKDKFFIGFLEQISRLDTGHGNEFILSYDLTKFIKPTKIYKLQNLYGMLSINNFFWNNNKIQGDGQENKNEITNYLVNIYKIYYLFAIKKDNINFSNIENMEHVYKFNLLKHLYNNDEVRSSNYIKILTLTSIDNKTKDNRIENSNKIINFYKSYIETIQKENSVAKISTNLNTDDK